MKESNARYSVGQLIHHRLFRYRGVIVDVDAEFSGKQEWYDVVARSKPPKDRPWYHVLVDNGRQTTYVAERNLEPDPSEEPIRHPSVRLFFERFEEGRYVMVLN